MNALEFLARNVIFNLLGKTEHFSVSLVTENLVSTFIHLIYYHFSLAIIYNMSLTNDHGYMTLICLSMFR